jgi:hypothetical protein
MASHSSLQKGYYNHPLYQTWERMLRRCTDPKCSDYDRYGAKGIRVCTRWFYIENFIFDMGERPIGFTLDRINNEGWYTPENCRWASAKTQTRNSSVPKLNVQIVEEIKKLRFTKKLSYRKLGKIYNVDHSTIYAIFKGNTWRQDGTTQTT